MILKLNIELDIAEDVTPEIILPQMNNLIESDDLFVGFWEERHSIEVLGMINALKVVRMSKTKQQTNMQIPFALYDAKMVVLRVGVNIRHEGDELLPNMIKVIRDNNVSGI